MTRLFATAALAGLLAAPAMAADHLVRIEGFAFSPANVQVAPGDTVTFTNFDSAPHTATADSGAFDTGRLGRGESSRINISGRGSLSFFCAIHPRMRGQITSR